jgi:hypothetical protein
LLHSDIHPYHHRHTIIPPKFPTFPHFIVTLLRLIRKESFRPIFVRRVDNLWITFLSPLTERIKDTKIGLKSIFGSLDSPVAETKASLAELIYRTI